MINVGEIVNLYQKPLLKPRSFCIKFLTKVVWKLEKLKCQGFKKYMYDEPVIVNTAFSQLEYFFS